MGLESSARDWSRSHCSRSDVIKSSPVGGCEYKMYVRYVSTNEQSDLIQADANVKKARVAGKLTEIDSETKKRKDKSNQDLPDMSVREVRF